MKPVGSTLATPRTPFALLLVLVAAAVPVAAQNLRGEELLSAPSSGGVDSDEPVIASAGDRFYAAWYEADALTGRDVHFARSIDGGRSFAASVRLDAAPGAAAVNQPVLVAQDDFVGVFWLDDREVAGTEDVVGRISLDGGLTFGPELFLSGALAGDCGDADNLAAAVDLPNVIVGWEDDINGCSAIVPTGAEDYYIASSQDSGATWAAPVRVNRPAGGAASADVDDVTLAISGDWALAVWGDRRDGTADNVYAASSTDGGLTWPATDVRVDTPSDPASDAEDPRVAIEGSAAVVFWRESRKLVAGEYQVYASATFDSGLTWLIDQRVDGAEAVATNSTTKRGFAALDGDDVHLVWADDRFAPGLDVHDIWYRPASLAGGTLTLGGEERMDVGSAPGAHDAGLPRVAAKDGYVHVLWQDRRQDPLGIDDSLFLRMRSNSASAFGPEVSLSAALGQGADAEESDVAISEYRDVVCVWADDRGDPLNVLNEIRVNGARLPSLSNVGPAGFMTLRVDDTAPVDEGHAFLALFSVSGTAYASTPFSTTGLGLSLTIDPVTSAGLTLAPFLLGPIVGGSGQTLTLPAPPFPVQAIGVLFDPAQPVDLYAATDPIVVVP